MMDAVEFFEEKDRMCQFLHFECKKCGINALRRDITGCFNAIRKHPAEAVEIVEKWSKAHPKKTRQSEFLKMFPDADIAEDGYLRINPCYLSQGRCPKNADFNCCVKCREQFWSEEVE